MEHATGRLVLDTFDGPLAVTTAPEELEGVEVGDIVRVSFAADDED